jgi:hypothetical protein
MWLEHGHISQPLLAQHRGQGTIALDIDSQFVNQTIVLDGLLVSRALWMEQQVIVQRQVIMDTSTVHLSKRRIRVGLQN